MKKHQYLFLLIVLVMVQSFFYFSCKKKQTMDTLSEIPIEKSTFTWYSFSNGEVKKIDNPKNSPATIFKPWTEAVRISSISCGDSIDGNNQKGYAVVNRYGILVFDNDNINLYSDIDLFCNRTAGNLVFYNGVPIFSIYKSSFFNNDKETKKSDFNPFLIQFSPDEKIFYPIFDLNTLGLDNSFEVNDFIWDGKVWTFSAKSSVSEKVHFSYFNLQTKEPLLSISPTNSESSVFVKESTVDNYRNIQKNIDFSNAPERIKEILIPLKDKSSFNVSCYTAGGVSPRVFSFKKNNDDENDKILYSTAILSEYWCAALFEDGTIFMKGALAGSYIINNGRTVVLKLPKLPSGFVYSGFSISDKYLYAAWEETSFFKTSKSGFISLDLEKIL